MLAEVHNATAKDWVCSLRALNFHPLIDLCAHHNHLLKGLVNQQQFSEQPVA